MKEKTTLTFTGDIGFDHYMSEKWNDNDLVDPAIRDIFRNSDHVVINVEGPIVDPEAELVKAAEMRLMHTINPASVPFLKKLPADIWNLCNNHIMDAGPIGLSSTLDIARGENIRTIGVGMDINEAAEPLLLDEAGGIGMFAVGYQRGCKPAGPDKAGCLNWADFDVIQDTINKIKSKCRWCIIVSHGGEEFTSLPSPYTRDRYLKYLEMGADIIVCHHPHVPMNYEIIDHSNLQCHASDSDSDLHGSTGGFSTEKAIFYSLGNFIFDTDYQRAQFNTEKGVVLSLSLTPESYDFNAYGIKIDRDKERVAAADLPLIFENVPADEYEKLAPLSAKAFVEATKKQQMFLYPDEYKNADAAKWEENFMKPMRSGRVPGEALDFQIICPFAETAEQGAWKDSKLEHVKKYILEQL
ncbi:MAG: CapA family protein [Eubacterium sp.]|nr:CapA family protein [Eubacterium sp.]